MSVTFCIPFDPTQTFHMRQNFVETGEQIQVVRGQEPF